MIKQQLKRGVKPILLSAKRKIADKLHRYNRAELAAKLRDFGIGPGDSLMMHSGFDQFNGFEGSPDDVIEVCQEVIGESGNLLMMSMPYGGSSQRYAEAEKTFEVSRTPSALGLISESFRRRPGVLRSANPLHPVLASGPLAPWYVADHELLLHSCGRRSPFARLLSRNGKFLFFDAVFRSLTFVHYVEDKYQQHLPVQLYDVQPAELKVRLGNGKELVTKQYLFSAAARERRNFAAIENAMLAAGTLQSQKIGNTDLLFCRASDVVDTSEALTLEGDGFYC